MQLYCKEIQVKTQKKYHKLLREVRIPCVGAHMCACTGACITRSYKLFNADRVTQGMYMQTKQTTVYHRGGGNLYTGTSRTSVSCARWLRYHMKKASKRRRQLWRGRGGEVFVVFTLLARGITHAPTCMHTPSAGLNISGAPRQLQSWAFTKLFS